MLGQADTWDRIHRSIHRPDPSQEEEIAETNDEYKLVPCFEENSAMASTGRTR